MNQLKPTAVEIALMLCLIPYFKRVKLRDRVKDYVQGIVAFCAPEGISYAARWELDEGDLYKASGDLRNKGIVVSISSQLNLQLS